MADEGVNFVNEAGTVVNEAVSVANDELTAEHESPPAGNADLAVVNDEG
jgi:hypothetical protein